MGKTNFNKIESESQKEEPCEVKRAECITFSKQ